MVQVNKSNRTVTVELESCDVEQLTNMQAAIIDLLKGYRYEDYGTGSAQTVDSALDLLTALLPSCEQQKRAFANELTTEKTQNLEKLKLI